MEESLAAGGRLLVHCSQGVSRSASLVIAYLMWRDGKEYEETFRRVKAVRGIANPNMASVGRRQIETCPPAEDKPLASSGATAFLPPDAPPP